jgi:hypothetical protein
MKIAPLDGNCFFKVAKANWSIWWAFEANTIICRVKALEHRGDILDISRVRQWVIWFEIHRLRAEERTTFCGGQRDAPEERGIRISYRRDAGPSTATAGYAKFARPRFS